MFIIALDIAKCAVWPAGSRGASLGRRSISDDEIKQIFGRVGRTAETRKGEREALIFTLWLTRDSVSAYQDPAPITTDKKFLGIMSDLDPPLASYVQGYALQEASISRQLRCDLSTAILGVARVFRVSLSRKTITYNEGKSNTAMKQNVGM